MVQDSQTNDWKGYFENLRMRNMGHLKYSYDFKNLSVVHAQSS